MTSIKLLFAALIIALIPATSSAEDTPQELSEALFIAAHLGHMLSIVDLVERGADVNYLNNDRETPMHAAAARGHLRVMQYLKDQHAYLHPRTVQNWIPLHHAVRFGHEHIVHYLVANGAPLNAVTRTGQSVFDIAKGIGDMRLLGVLERYNR